MSWFPLNSEFLEEEIKVFRYSASKSKNSSVEKFWNFMFGHNKSFLEIRSSLRFSLLSFVNLAHKSSSVNFLNFEIVQLLQILFDFRFGQILIHFELKSIWFMGNHLSRTMQHYIQLEELVLRLLLWEIAICGDVESIRFQSIFPH